MAKMFLFQGFENGGDEVCSVVFSKYPKKEDLTLDLDNDSLSALEKLINENSRVVELDGITYSLTEVSFVDNTHKNLVPTSIEVGVAV